jgi:ATP-binding cassette, subfamily F, member 3
MKQGATEMAILTFHNLAQSFAGIDIFTGASARIDEDSRIGLVGPNGVGKTTLLKIIAGLARPDDGSVSMSPGLRLGYLQQEAMEAFSGRENTLIKEMYTVFAGVRDMELRMRELEELMADDPSNMAVIDEYGDITTEFERIGGYDYELRIEQTLTGLGFKPQHYELPLDKLSGGQKTRALLARLLLEAPDLLVLDEPTNHLDVQAVQYLERTLSNWRGALLIVSHDRYFLDRVANTIWEMSALGIDAYRGNYSAYLYQRSHKTDYETTLYEQEYERMAKELDYIKRNIARASTNGMAVGRLRRLSRDLVAIERVGLIAYKQSKSWLQSGIGNVRPLGVQEAEQMLKAIPAPKTRIQRPHVRLSSGRRSGEWVLSGRKLTIGYPDAPLFETDEFTLDRGACAALIGPNGTGKTTLLKSIMGKLKPLKGTLQTGLNVRIGYFAQAHDDMNPDNTVMDELMRHKRMKISEARGHLGPYLFGDDDIVKKVSALSGGERARLALAILALEGANFLLLDEPTNHLDIPAQEVLQEVLENFDGAILLVSHDRYIIDRLATQIWNLEDGHMEVFEGGYADFVAMQEALREAARTEKTPQRPQRRTPPADMGKLEAQIESLEYAMRDLESLIAKASAAGKTGDVERMGEEYAANQARLEDLLEQWETVAAG